MLTAIAIDRRDVATRRSGHARVAEASSSAEPSRLGGARSDEASTDRAVRPRRSVQCAPPWNGSTEYKVIVIGSGPAGCTAALYLSRANLVPLVLEGMQPGGQLTITTDVENYPGFPEGILGPKLMDLMRQQAERFGAVFRMEQVESVELPHASVRRSPPTSASTRRTRVIIAAGASAMQIGLPSREGAAGLRRLVLRDVRRLLLQEQGDRRRRRRRLGDGGGDVPHEVRQRRSRSSIAARSCAPRRSCRSARERIRRSSSSSTPTVDEVIGTKEGGVTVAEAAQPEDERGDARCRRRACSSPSATRRTRSPTPASSSSTSAATSCLPHRHSTVTNIQGVFACGDCVDHIYRQAVTAAGSGCQAALDCERWLTHERITERWDLPAGRGGAD